MSTKKAHKASRGGARRGAGRKALSSTDRMRSVPLVLTLQQLTTLDAAAERDGVSRSAVARSILDRHHLPARAAAEPASMGDAPAAAPTKSTAAAVSAAKSPLRAPGATTTPRKSPSRRSKAASPPTVAHIYHLKVTVLGVEPRIWRRLQVTADTLLSELHTILQIAIGWENCHLHRFDIGGAYVGNTGDGGSEAVALQEIIPATRPTASAHLGPRMFFMESDHRFTFHYEYDMGDFWQHEIVVEKTTKLSRGLRYPRCVAGAQVGPPEDCGGPNAYAAKLRRRRRKPPKFDREAVNAALGKMAQKRLAAG